MKLQFDANQSFQLDAINAVADLFEGQPQGAPEFSVVQTGAWEGLFASQARSELGAGNQLLLPDSKLRSNARVIQLRNDIEIADPNGALESWELFDTPANRIRNCPHFSVEMETGTGKTYVYLRTIFELSRRYGFRKFVIVVPSVAIREGVLKNIEITRGHFEALFDNLRFESYVYDAKRVSQLRQFGTSTTLQVLVINIDAFRKNFTGTEAEQKSNVIYKESDKLSGRQPIEFVQAARPIVIIDEPQSVDSTEKSQEAIRALNPLCTLRYSATHRNPYNLLYRLDPIRAFELKLVKQIVVASAVAENSANDAFVRVEAVDYKKGIKAKLRILVQTPPSVPKEKVVTVKNGDNLFTHSKERANYKDGYEVAEINAEPGKEFIRFSSGRILRLGEESGGARSDVWKIQIRETIRRHLTKELQVGGRGIKVLSLFFIDRVANYRDYDANGHVIPGRFAAVFEAELSAAAKEEQFRSLAWLRLPVESLHNGYFAADRRKVQGNIVEILKDTRGDTQADEEVYDLIMKEKERLLSIDEPLRFIFSHSALREGWDNPNVFQICTLNETRSAMKKRQEIGRGLRLPVDQNGLRVFDDSVNKLYVMANESYDDFARGLQREYEEECGVTFGRVPLTAFIKLSHLVDGEEIQLGNEAAEMIRSALVAQKILDDQGRIQPVFDPKREGFKLDLPAPFVDLTPAVIDLLSSYQIERHVRRDRDERTNHFRKEIALTPEFAALWDRIKPKTTYRVEFATDALVAEAVRELKKMPRVEVPVIRLREGQIGIERGGVTATPMRVADAPLKMDGVPLPDILAYLQNETELTRSTIVRILRESGRLIDFFINPQRFMDSVALVLRHVLHRMIVDGIKYERIAGEGSVAEWEMRCFKNEELINYLSALEVSKSVYEYVVYDSEVERRFAATLDARPEIKLFVKLPKWFKIDTPVGTYNPDWAIVKHDDQTLYLVRETKATRDYLKLRTTERDKVHCGTRHFEELGVDFKVAVSADDV
jgi:type III restriction enzyme